MGQEFNESVEPVTGKAGIPAMNERPAAERPERPTTTIEGRIVAVHRRTPHHDGDHKLDVTVGGEEHTELVVRIPSGPYSHLEGRNVLLVLES
jgi:hypothetical protein